MRFLVRFAGLWLRGTKKSRKESLQDGSTLVIEPMLYDIYRSHPLRKTIAPARAL